MLSAFLLGVSCPVYRPPPCSHATIGKVIRILMVVTTSANAPPWHPRPTQGQVPGKGDVHMPPSDVLRGCPSGQPQHGTALRGSATLRERPGLGGTGKDNPGTELHPGEAPLCVDHQGLGGMGKDNPGTQQYPGEASPRGDGQGRR